MECQHVCVGRKCPEHGCLLNGDRIDQLEATIAAKDKQIAELKQGELSFYEYVDLTKGWLEKYPPDIFTGESGDPGPLFVVAIRTAIEGLDKARQALAQQGGSDD